MSADNSQSTIENDSNSDDLPEYSLLLDGSKYFRVIKETRSGKITAACIDCENGVANVKKKTSNKFKYRGSRSSNSNFIKHLKSIHPDLHKQYLEENPSKRRKISYETYEIMDLHEKQNLTEEYLIEFLVNNFIPMYVINEGFMKIIQNLNKHINIDNPTELQLKIQTSVNQLKDNFTTEFEQVSFFSFAAIPVEIHKIVYMLIVCFWLDTAELSRQHAVLSCKIVDSNNLESSALDAILNTMTDYRIKKEQVRSIVLNDAVQYDDDFSKFINDPKISPSSGNYYAIPSSYDDDIVQIPTVQTILGDIDDIKMENSIVHQIMMFGIKDFILLLEQHNKIDFHYRVFSKVNKIWNVAVDNKELIESVCDTNIEGPSKNHITSFYKSVQIISGIANKLSTLARRVDGLVTFNDSELIYLEEIIKFLWVIKGAIEALESDKNGLYGNAAPILLSLKVRLEELDFVELEEIHAILVENFQSKFEDYLTIDLENTAMFAACFHPSYKRDWIPANERQNVKEMCKDKVSEIAPKTATRRLKETESSVEPRDLNFVILRPHDNLKEKDNVHIEPLTFFNDPLQGVDQLNNLPSVKKLFIKYNTTICNPMIVKHLIEQTNILKIVESKLRIPELVNNYSIINAATMLQPEEEEETEEDLEDENEE